MYETVTTHYVDALRYIDCGWKVLHQQTVAVRGTNKTYIEVTLHWDTSIGEIPVYPEGEHPDIVFT